MEDKIVHNVAYTGKIHGYHLVNVQVSCGEILTQASPVSQDAVRFGVLCKDCSTATIPQGHKVLHVRESDGDTRD